MANEAKKYILIAYNKNDEVVMSDLEENKSSAFIGFDIWCDPTLDKSGTIETVRLADAETGEILLEENIRREK